MKKIIALALVSALLISLIVVATYKSNSNLVSANENNYCYIEQIQFIKRNGEIIGAVIYPSGQELIYDGARLVPYCSNVFDCPEYMDKSKFSEEEIKLILEE